MSCRHGYTRMAMLLGLLAPLGCARWQVNGPVPVTVTHSPRQAGQPATELNPQNAALLCLTAGEALEKKGYTAEAIHQYENARTHDPQLKLVSRRLAVLYDMQGDAQRAETEYQRALNEQPGDAELLNDLGYFHYRHDRAKNAEAWLRNAVGVDPNCRCAWINLGQVLAKQGRFDESLQAFAHVLRPAEAYSNVGVLLAKQGRTEEARTAFQQALALDPSLKQPKAFLSALARPPALLPPGITRTTTPASPIVPPVPPPSAIVTTAPFPPPIRMDHPTTPVLTRKASPITPSTPPASPSADNSPPFMTSASPLSPRTTDTLPPARKQIVLPSVAKDSRVASGTPIPLPVVTNVPLPPPAISRTPPPARMPAPFPVVLHPSPSVPGTPLRPAVSPTPASPQPASLPPRVATAPSAKLHEPSPRLGAPPPNIMVAPQAPSITAKPTSPLPSDGPIPRASAPPAADPETASRSPIVILTDCERAKDASPP